MADSDLIELAMRMVKTGEPNARQTAAGESDARPQQRDEVQTPPPLPAATESAGLSHHAPVKGNKTADELAAMILSDLKQIKGCPKAGINVTVYGSNPWNSWLSFGGAAGPVPNRIELQDFCGIITERLKRLYQISA